MVYKWTQISLSTWYQSHVKVYPNSLLFVRSIVPYAIKQISKFFAQHVYASV